MQIQDRTTSTLSANPHVTLISNCNLPCIIHGITAENNLQSDVAEVQTHLSIGGWRTTTTVTRKNAGASAVVRAAAI